MKLIENIVYLTYSDMEECGVKKDTAKKNVLRGTFKAIDDPADNRITLINYDELKDNYKKQVIALFGNPYEYMVKAPIKKLVEKDFKADEFFHAYQVEPGKKLPAETITKYCNEAAWLNMMLDITSSVKRCKQLLNIEVIPFFDHLKELLKIEISAGRISANFPTSYSKLRSKMSAYKTGRYPALISKHIVNQRAAKVTDELSEATLKTMLAHSNQYDCALIAHQYNQWAVANNYKPITRATVHNKLQEWAHEIKQEREGLQAYNTDMRRKVSRSRPSRPLALVESDDNHLDWWFKGNKNTDYKRIKGIIVTDSFNDYVLGYALTDGDLAGTEIVKLAYLNAMHHIHELTGGWYLPFEVKTDQWNIAQLEPFYKSIAHYEATPVGSKNRGWLENFFGHIDWERSLKIGNNNYNGHNVTAKTTGVNRDVVLANRKNWPHLNEAESQMAEFVHRLRTAPRNYNPQNKSRQQEWLEAWAALPEAKKIPITDEQRLLKFGVCHSELNAITSQGIRPTIMGNKYAYSVPPALYIQNNGKKVQVMFDPYDMNSVLITDNEKLRFIAKSMVPVAGCMADMQENGGRALLNKILEEAKADGVNATAKAARRQAVLADAGVNVEDILKLGVSAPKQLKQLAEALHGLPVDTTYLLQDVEETEPEEFNVYADILNR